MILTRLLFPTALAAVALPAFAQDPATVQPEATHGIAERESVRAEHYMVAAAHPLAAEAGYGVLAAGGSAADAAVAVQMVLNVVEPQSSGIGGGGFLLYWSAAEARLTSFDGRETAPAAAGPDYWTTPEGAPMEFWDAVVGGRSVGVPGALKLMETVHARHGRLPWPDLMAPAIGLAEEGFEVSPRLSASIAEAQAEGLDRFPEAREHFFDAEGNALAAGATLSNPAFARTLRLIAEHGSAPLYEGAIARDIVAAVRTETNPGMLTLEDLAGYEVVEREPVCAGYRGHEVCGMGPPSSGGLTVGQILGMLEASDLAAMGPGPEALHRFVEASRLAFADRGLYMADADFVDMPTAGLLDPDYLAGRAGLIAADAVMEAAEPGEPPWDDAMRLAPDTERPRQGTTHFVIVDGYGDMVSATTSIEQGFGSRVMTNGFLLNNELTDFAFEAEADGAPVANRVEGGKRPRSSMAPTIVLRDGEPVLLVGSPGGARIIPYVALALIGTLDWGLDPQEAIDRPHVTDLGGGTQVETGGAGGALAEGLRAIGHAVERADLNSGLHVIQVTEEGLVGAADKRREGVAIGD